MKPTLVRTAVITSTTLMTLGLAGPASACLASLDGGGATQAAALGSPAKSDPADKESSKDAAPTLEEVQARVDARLAKHLTKLSDAKTRVADSTTLTDEEKAEKTAWLDARIAAVEALRVQVAAAPSIEEIKAAIKASDLGGLRWGGRHHKGHGHKQHAQKHDKKHGHHSRHGDRDADRSDRDRSDRDRASNHRSHHSDGNTTSVAAWGGSRTR